MVVVVDASVVVLLLVYVCAVVYSDVYLILLSVHPCFDSAHSLIAHSNGIYNMNINSSSKYVIVHIIYCVLYGSECTIPLFAIAALESFYFVHSILLDLTRPSSQYIGVPACSLPL